MCILYVCISNYLGFSFGKSEGICCTLFLLEIHLNSDFDLTKITILGNSGMSTTYLVQCSLPYSSSFNSVIKLN